MDSSHVVKILREKFNFSESSLHKINVYKDELLKYNNRYNLISKSSESSIWMRHILDSAQIIDYINCNQNASLSDLGSGAGFPGMVLAIFNEKNSFHVKLYEKSTIKCQFLKKISEMLNIRVDVIEGNLEKEVINSEYIVCRAFKKFNEILRISREIVKKPHKLIVLKGKSAQEEINKASNNFKDEYKLVKSITNEESKIIIVNVK